MGNHVIMFRGLPELRVKFERFINDIVFIKPRGEVQGCKCTEPAGFKPLLREIRLYDISLPNALSGVFEDNVLHSLHTAPPFKIPPMFLKLLSRFKPFKYDPKKYRYAVRKPFLYNAAIHVLGYRPDPEGVYDFKCPYCRHKMTKPMDYIGGV